MVALKSLQDLELPFNILVVVLAIGMDVLLPQRLPATSGTLYCASSCRFYSLIGCCCITYTALAHVNMDRTFCPYAFSCLLMPHGSAATAALVLLLHFLPTQVEFTVDSQVPEGWSHKTGHVSQEMIQDTLFPPAAGDTSKGGTRSSGGGDGGPTGGTSGSAGGAEAAAGAGGGAGGSAGAGGGDGGSQGGDVVTLLCGPPPMIEKACKPALSAVGFDEQHTIEF